MSATVIRPGLRGEPDRQPSRRSVATSTVYFLYYDAHGNLAAEADASGNSTASHTYDPFGAPTDTQPSNTTVPAATSRPSRIRFTASL